MTIEIVDFPIENGDFPNFFHSYVSHYQRVAFLAPVGTQFGDHQLLVDPCRTSGV
jgi:hypothetical protein